MTNTRRLAFSTTVVCAMTALLHATVLRIVSGDLNACCIAPDTATYVDLSRSGWFDFVRLPGYPAFLAAVRRLFGDGVLPVLWVQAGIAALTAALVGVLAHVLLPRFRYSALIAGLFMGCSFTTVRLGHFVLTENLSGLLVVAAFTLLVWGARSGSITALVASSICGGLAFLVKPAFVVWGLLAPAIAVLVARRRPPATALVLVAAVSLAFPVAWAFVNWMRFGVLTPSGGSASTACVYLAARARAIVVAPTGPRKELIVEQQSRLLAEGQAIESTRDSYRFYSDCLKRTALQHPVATWRAFRLSLMENLPRPFDADELRWNGTASMPQKMGRLLLARFTDLIYVVALLGALRLISIGEWHAVAALGLLFGAVAGLSAVSFYQGARLMYPLDFALGILVAAACTPREALPHAAIQAAVVAPPAASPAISVVVPVGRYSEQVSALLASLLPLSTPWEVVVVEDRPDARVEAAVVSAAAVGIPIHLYRHSEPRGYGAATTTGIAQSRGAVVVVHRPEAVVAPGEYERLAKPILDGDADVVYANRDSSLYRHVAPLSRRCRAALVSGAASVVSNLVISDVDTCVKAARGALIRGTVVDGTDADFDSELTARLARTGARFVELAVRITAECRDRDRTGPAATLSAVFGTVRGRFAAASAQRTL